MEASTLQSNILVNTESGCATKGSRMSRHITVKKKHNRRIVYVPNGRDPCLIIQSRDGFGKPKDGSPSFTIPGKGIAANTIACNAWELLVKNKIPTCFIGRMRREDSYRAEECRSIPLVVVVRRFAMGSFAERYPHRAGERFEDPFVEVFHKYKEYTPLSVDEKDVLRMKELALQAFLLIEAKFKESGVTILDIHFEFGINSRGEIVILDAIDNKAWRLLGPDGCRIDGEYYQHIKNPTQEDFDEIKRRYTLVVEITNGWHRK